MRKWKSRRKASLLSEPNQSYIISANVCFFRWKCCGNPCRGKSHYSFSAVHHSTGNAQHSPFYPTTNKARFEKKMKMKCNKTNFEGKYGILLVKNANALRGCTRIEKCFPFSSIQQIDFRRKICRAKLRKLFKFQHQIPHSRLRHSTGDARC